MPRFIGENPERNQHLIETLQKLADEKGLRPSQVAIARVLAKGTRIVPVICAGVDMALFQVQLSGGDLTRSKTRSQHQVGGSRYSEDQMLLASEH